MEVPEEVKLLVREIKRLGTRDAHSGKIKVPYGTLTHDARCEQIFEAIVGTLKAGKKRKVLTFEGEMLLSPAHDKVDIVLLEEDV